MFIVNIIYACDNKENVHKFNVKNQKCPRAKGCHIVSYKNKAHCCSYFDSVNSASKSDSSEGTKELRIVLFEAASIVTGKFEKNLFDS